MGRKIPRHQVSQFVEAQPLGLDPVEQARQFSCQTDGVIGAASLPRRAALERLDQPRQQKAPTHLRQGGRQFGVLETFVLGGSEQKIVGIDIA